MSDKKVLLQMMEIPQDYVDIRNAYLMSNGNKDLFACL